MYMENQNIPFRELRKPRKGWSRLKRKSLLMPLRKIDPEGKQNSNQSSIMGQNVSQYLHMLADCHTKENYIKWATNLRSTPQKHSSVAKDGLPPGVSFKKTKCFEIKEDLIKVDDRKKFNTADYIQYFSKTENHHMFNESSLGYVTSLRGYHSSANRDKELFSSIPFKERKNDPTFLKKESVRKTRFIKNDDKETALDGDHRYPSYTENILRDKNYGLLCTFTDGKKKVSLPTLAWQVGLRSY